MSFLFVDNDGDENNEGAATVAGAAILVAQANRQSKGTRTAAAGKERREVVVVSEARVFEVAGKGRDVVISQRLLMPMAGEAAMERLGTANHTQHRASYSPIFVQLGSRAHAPGINSLMSSSLAVSSW